MEEGGSSGMPPAAIDARLLRFFSYVNLKKESITARQRKKGREEIKPSSHFDADLCDFGSNQSEKSVLY